MLQWDVLCNNWSETVSHLDKLINKVIGLHQHKILWTQDYTCLISLPTCQCYLVTYCAEQFSVNFKNIFFSKLIYGFIAVVKIE